MLQQCVAQNLAFGVEAHEHLQVAAKAACCAFNGSAEVLLAGILGLVDDEGEFLSLRVVLADGVGVSHRELAATHDSLDAVLKRLLLLQGNRLFGDVVHKGEYAARDECNACEYQHHIGD